MSQNSLFDYIRESAGNQLWSRGVQVSRASTCQLLSREGETFRIRISTQGKIISPIVVLDGDDDIWSCDCADRDDPCTHVIAAAIALRAGSVEAPLEEADSSAVVAQSGQQNGYFQYSFVSYNGALTLERYLVQNNSRQLFSESLVTYLGGIQSGRIKESAPTTSRADLDVDVVLQNSLTRVLDSTVLRLLLKHLASCTNVTLDGKSISTRGSFQKPQLEMLDDGQGIKVRRLSTSNLGQVFTNGAALIEDRLVPFEIPKSLVAYLDAATESGRTFSRQQLVFLASQLLPLLSTVFEVTNNSRQLPEIVTVDPSIEIRTVALEDGILSLTPEIVYGTPPIARCRTREIEYLDPRRIPKRRLDLEQQLVRELRSEMNLQIGQSITLRGEEAVRFLARPLPGVITGEGKERFQKEGPLTPLIELTTSGLNISFQSSQSKQLVTSATVLRAWRNGESLISLDEGGWAALPKSWLETHGPFLERLLDNSNRGQNIPQQQWPELEEWVKGEGGRVDTAISRFCEQLVTYSDLPEADLDSGCLAIMRDYQRLGSRWMRFLADHQMGALLADDMGLGKTLQSLAMVRGRSLVVTPTSVISGWMEQAKRFRPNLCVALYHGPNRKLDGDSSLTITTYGLLRADIETLQSISWDLVILDESQTIKNPESQVAQAAFRLKAKARVALSGTPVENDLEDLWSQMHFLNPGLLGSRNEFRQRFGQNTEITESTPSLTKIIKPFILRREKREVETMLPPRTEMKMEVDFSDSERVLYESLLLAARKDVISLLESGGNILSALEIILRLRQACCHPSLVPGQSAESSAKLNLLAESIQQSIVRGHKLLVFSQWTSFLDLIGAKLSSLSIDFLRLDGSTRNREQIVETFQSLPEKKVMLISLKAGGTGLTLTAADHVYITDPWWNPAVENQAADRAHRIGQQRAVMIYKLIVRNSIEENILKLQERKSLIADGLLKDGSAALRLTREDLIELLSD